MYVLLIMLITIKFCVPIDIFKIREEIKYILTIVFA